MEAADILESEARWFRASGGLGRSPPLLALFDYLLAASLEGRAPKEDEIGIAVFNREPGFDRGQDSVVRVYAHRLRRSLEAAYADIGRASLELPRGEYRLQIAQPESEPGSDIVDARAQWGRWTARRLSLRGVILVAVLAAAFSALASWALLSHRHGDDDIAAARASPLWSPLLANGLPTLVVLGDYYLVGESDDGLEVNRLVREFDVNGSADLERYFIAHPEKMGRYVDMDLRYLPTSTAAALGRVMPVLARMTGTSGLSMIMASEMTPAMLKGSNIVYVGLVSGMGPLRQSVFTASRFAVGDDFDEIVDMRTRHHYISQAAMPQKNIAYADYGLVSTYRGPENNVIVVLAGTRDTALQQISEMATGVKAMEAASRRAGGSASFEALYKVGGLDKMNVTGELLAASPLDSARIWEADDGTPRVH